MGLMLEHLIGVVIGVFILPPVVVRPPQPE